MMKSAWLTLIFIPLSAMALVAELPQVTLIAPNGGEDLSWGTEFTIIWNCSNCAGNLHVMVEIYNIQHSGAGYHGQISPAGVPMNQGFFKWPLVGKLADGTWLNPGPGYKIHLEAMDGSDASDGTFAIVKLKFPPIAVSHLNLHLMPDCPECVRVDLRPLREAFKNCREAYRIALFAAGEKIAALGDFGGPKQTNDFLSTRINLPFQVQARQRRGRFELRLFNAQGQLLQAREVQLNF